MREHMGLYRGKRGNGEWVEGFYMNLGRKYHYILTGELDITGAFPFLVKYEVDPNTVGECTGLRDKNGKFIFEGDILLVKTMRESLAKETRNDEYTAYGVVVFNEGRYELEGKGLVLCTYWGLKLLYTAASFKEYEIIGNIHDNPELLKGGEG